MLFDSHAHINDAKYNNDLDGVLARAREAGVGRILDVGYDRPTIARSAQISTDHDWVYSAFGFHPHEASQIKEEDYDWLKEQWRFERCVAIGEIGLDRVRECSPLDAQRQVLHHQLAMVKEAGKPVIFHSRGAEEEVLQAAKSTGIEKAVFHCYTGPWEIAKKILDHGYYLSFAGFLTFPKGMPDWLDRVPLERILIETDCPYLAPVPFRGKRNEPGYVKYVCGAVAKALGQPVEEVGSATAENAARLFQVELG